MHLTVLTNPHNKYEKSLNLICLEYHGQSSAQFVTISCWKLSRALRAVPSCRQLLTALQSVASFDCCYKLLAGWMAVTSCQQLWQMLQAVSSFESCYKLLTVFTAVISCQQFLQLLQAVDSFESCYKLLTVISVVTSCWQLRQLSHGVNSCETETSCQQLSLHKQALDSFDNHDSFCKQLAACTLIQSPKRSSMMAWRTEGCGLGRWNIWQDGGGEVQRCKADQVCKVRLALCELCTKEERRRW